MRKKRTSGGLTVQAVSGTYVVMLGWDIAPAKRNGLLGFAISREDHSEDERYWLKGMKTFAATDPGLGPGGQISSREHPFQTFQWGDYTAKPEHEYSYTVLPLYGTPANLTEGQAVKVRVRTESELGASHSVFFNRGAVASQEYARRFLNKPPDEIGPPAYRWLSRGLHEALLAFIARAKSSAFGLHGAVYEFQHPEVLSAVKAAAAAGAKVKIVYDAVPGGPVKKNEAAIAAAGIKQRCVGRKNGKLMHNKFFVLTKNAQPIAVWTGSTNATLNGIFGHSNCGHLVEDPAVAARYLEYWKELREDPETADLKDWIEANNVAPPVPDDAAVTTVFSPRRGISVLEDWYAGIAGGAQRALFMTFAFGMHKCFQKVYERPDGVLRFALMEKEGSGAGLAQAKKDIRRIRALPNVLVALGNNIRTNSFDRWLREIEKVTAEAHVLWIHTKYMLVDPLSTQPVVITGSANFSKASTDTNDENMLVIRGNRRVADIYLGEYMRLYSHYAFREAVRIHLENGGDPELWNPSHLAANDGWVDEYFEPGNDRSLRREYFSGS